MADGEVVEKGPALFLRQGGGVVGQLRFDHLISVDVVLPAVLREALVDDVMDHGEAEGDAAFVFGDAMCEDAALDLPGDFEECADDAAKDETEDEDLWEGKHGLPAQNTESKAFITWVCGSAPAR